MINELLKEHSNQYVILVDLSWILYRSHYAFKYLTNDEGIETGSYYGLSKTIQTLTESYEDCLILLVDDGNPVERKELNESYKGNREHSVHFSDKKHTVDCMIQYLPNVYRVYHPTLEADDLMFSISRIKDFNNFFIIYSSDKDLYQSIDETTRTAKELSKGELQLVDTLSDSYVDNFKDLEPFQIPYYRAVLGDASDNLPIIRPRFPSKVAYLFAKNFIIKENNEVKVYPYSKLDGMTDTQYSQLIEIYQSPVFLNNLKLMKLERKDDIPIVDKVKTSIEVQDTLVYLQLRKYVEWLEEYVKE